MFVDLTAALLGGALVGLSAALFMWTHGRIAGVSGMLGGVLASLLPGPSEGGSSRAGFLAGLVAAGALFGSLWPGRFSTAGLPSLPWLVLAGLLVGYGTRIGGGCTSGHGICGIGRGQPRSLAATGIFVAVAMLTVWLRQL